LEAFGKPVCRLGLALRGSSRLNADDVHEAIARGVNFLNWPAASEYAPREDAMSVAVSALGGRRESVVVCIQLAARTARDAAGEVRTVLAALATDYIDLVTLYYVERQDEWESVIAPRGALGYLRRAQADGVVRRVGMTTHQRPLAALAVRSGLLDALLIRYNAAHRGAETDVFPITDALAVPVVAYTALRWGALLRATPDDPPGFAVPSAANWYRFVLDCPSVAVVLAAPTNRQELDEDLQVLTVECPLDRDTFDLLAAHGQRVRQHAGAFP
jgi:predicted aldo/keto reductase-like oxidoreductase